MASSNQNEMWCSKLGTQYPKTFILQNEKKFLKELQNMRSMGENRHCADCHSKGCTVWASVNLGVFLCMACGSHHRSLGTHISLPKGCTGTYLWGPDEIETMKKMGNERAARVYGTFIPEGVSVDNAVGWKQYLVDKYVNRKFAPKSLTDHEKTSPSKEVDLINLFEHSPTMASFRHSNPLLDGQHIGTKVSPGEDSKTIALKPPTVKSGDDFFANFGL